MAHDCRTCKYGTIHVKSNEWRPCSDCYGYPDRNKWEPQPPKVGAERIAELEGENSRLQAALKDKDREIAILKRAVDRALDAIREGVSA